MEGCTRCWIRREEVAQTWDRRGEEGQGEEGWEGRSVREEGKEGRLEGGGSRVQLSGTCIEGDEARGMYVSS